MIRMMLASGAKPDVPDENGMFPEEAAGVPARPRNC